MGTSKKGGKVKICMVTEYVAPEGEPPLGGVGKRTKELAKHMAKKHDVHLITSKLDGTDRKEKLGEAIVHRVGESRKHVQRGDLWGRYKLNKKFKEKIIELNPDVVDASGFVAYPGSYKGAKQIGAKSCVTVHEVWQGEWIQNMGIINGIIGNILERFYLNRDFDQFITVSNFTKKRLLNKLKIKNSDVDVVYNGVDFELIDDVQINERYESPTIVSVGRLVPYKRYDLMLKVIKELQKEIEGIQLVLIGEGSEEENLKKLSKKLGIEDKVEFKGRIPDYEDLIKEMKKADMFSMTSITEGFGLVVIEAMASGLPYVITDIPPFREVTKNGKGGYLFETDNFDEYCSKIKKCLKKEKNFDSKKFVKENYDWGIVTKNLEKVYRGEN